VPFVIGRIQKLLDGNRADVIREGKLVVESLNNLIPLKFIPPAVVNFGPSTPTTASMSHQENRNGHDSDPIAAAGLSTSVHERSLPVSDTLGCSSDSIRTTTHLNSVLVTPAVDSVIGSRPPESELLVRERTPVVDSTRDSASSDITLSVPGELQ
jgi:hypothetical protein